MTTFPSFTRQELATVLGNFRQCSKQPLVDPFQIAHQLLQLKYKSLFCPGKTSVRLFHRFALFVATPLASILNLCLILHKFSNTWKKSCIKVMPKKSSPKSFTDLRPISLTPYMVKVTETFMSRLLLNDIELQIDPY